MDRSLQELRRDYATSGDPISADRLALALLRIRDLEYYEQQATSGDEEAIALINRMRQLASGLGNELEERHGRLQFVDKHGQSKMKYLNVYCQNIPIATVQITDYDELRSARNWFISFYDKVKPLLPPDQIRTTKMEGRNYFFVPLFHNKVCVSGEVLIEDESCFYLNAYRTKPKTLWVPDETPGMQREITEGDYGEDDYGQMSGLAEIMYDDLPGFAKHDNSINTPQYAVASEVTRGMRRYSDGSRGYDNFFNTIAIVYVGYIPNLLGNAWVWTDKEYRYICGMTDEYIQEQLAKIVDEYEMNEIYLARLLGRAPDTLQELMSSCPLAGREIMTGNKLEQCQACRGYYANAEYQPRRVILRENYLDYIEGDIPENLQPPPHLNEALAFLQRRYDDLIHGDIYSVLGGIDLSVGLYQASYEPEDLSSSSQ